MLVGSCVCCEFIIGSSVHVSLSVLCWLVLVVFVSHRIGFRGFFCWFLLVFVFVSSFFYCESGSKPIWY